VDGLDPIEPSDLNEYQTQQAARIRTFLKRLATDDDLLLRYINDRVAVLADEAKDEEGLTNEDVALLLDGDYSRISEVMSQGSEPLRWINVWIR
jgi:hypothetical protein